jgi:hypothetical protein
MDAGLIAAASKFAEIQESVEAKRAEWKRRRAITELLLLSRLSARAEEDVEGRTGASVCRFEARPQPLLIADMVAGGVVAPLVELVASERREFALSWPIHSMLTESIWLLTNLAAAPASSGVPAFLLFHSSLPAVLYEHLARLVQPLAQPTPEMSLAVIRRYCASSQVVPSGHDHVFAFATQIVWCIGNLFGSEPVTPPAPKSKPHSKSPKPNTKSPEPNSSLARTPPLSAKLTSEEGPTPAPSDLLPSTSVLIPPRAPLLSAARPSKHPPLISPALAPSASSLPKEDLKWEAIPASATGIVPLTAAATTGTTMIAAPGDAQSSRDAALSHQRCLRQCDVEQRVEAVDPANSTVTVRKGQDSVAARALARIARSRPETLATHGPLIAANPYDRPPSAKVKQPRDASGAVLDVQESPDSKGKTNGVENWMDEISPSVWDKLLSEKSVAAGSSLARRAARNRRRTDGLDLQRERFVRLLTRLTSAILSCRTPPAMVSIPLSPIIDKIAAITKEATTIVNGATKMLDVDDKKSDAPGIATVDLKDVKVDKHLEVAGKLSKGLGKLTDAICKTVEPGARLQAICNLTDAVNKITEEVGKIIVTNKSKTESKTESKTTATVKTPEAKSQVKTPEPSPPVTPSPPDTKPQTVVEAMVAPGVPIGGPIAAGMGGGWNLPVAASGLVQTCVWAICTLLRTAQTLPIPLLLEVSRLWPILIQLPSGTMRADLMFLIDRTVDLVQSRPDEDNTLKLAFFESLRSPEGTVCMARFANTVHRACRVTLWHVLGPHHPFKDMGPDLAPSWRQESEGEETREEWTTLQEGVAMRGLAALTTLTCDVDECTDAVLLLPGIMDWLASLIPQFLPQTNDKAKRDTLHKEGLVCHMTSRAMRIVANACGSHHRHIDLVLNHKPPTPNSFVAHRTGQSGSLLCRILRLLVTGNRPDTLRVEAAWIVGSLLLCANPTQLLRVIRSLKALTWIVAAMRDPLLPDRACERLAVALTGLVKRAAVEPELRPLRSSIRRLHLPALIASLLPNPAYHRHPSPHPAKALKSLVASPQSKSSPASDSSAPAQGVSYPANGSSHKDRPDVNGAKSKTSDEKADDLSQPKAGGRDTRFVRALQWLFPQAQQHHALLLACQTKNPHAIASSSKIIQ